jgi:hypothetical protein
MRRMIALILISICMAGAAAGCSGGAPGGGHGGAQGGGSQGGSSQGGGTEQTMAVMRQLAHCIRSHGMPGWPDPIINPLTSAPDWPQSAPRLPAGIQQACQSIANRLPPAAQQSQPPTPASMQALVRFALGEFPMTTQMAAQFKGTDRPAVGACIHYVPGGSQYLRFVGAAQQPGSAGNG